MGDLVQLRGLRRPLCGTHLPSKETAKEGEEGSKERGERRDGGMGGKGEGQKKLRV